MTQNLSDKSVRLKETTQRGQAGQSFVAETIINNSLEEVFDIDSNYAA